jgi:hypothetical protein
MATSTVLLEQDVETHFLLRRHILVSKPGPAAKVASRNQATKQDRQT